MRVFHVTSSADALQLLKNGFSDKQVGTYGLQGLTAEQAGVLFADTPSLDVNNGVEGDTVLSLEMPEETFAKHEGVEEGQSYRWALIPLDIARSLGKPSVHDHEYAMPSRWDLVKAADNWEAAGKQRGEDRLLKHAANMRAAIRFFDEVGWRNITTNAEKGADAPQ